MNKFEKMWKSYHFKKLAKATRKAMLKEFCITVYEGVVFFIAIAIMFIILYLI